MKITHALLLILLVQPLYNFASHSRTAEIRYRHVSGFTYEIKAITYTKASALLADRDTITVFLGDGTSAQVLRSNGPLVGGVPSGTVLSNDIRYNEYVCHHTYQGPGDYRISVVDNNRIDNILNIDAGRSVFVSNYTETLLRIPAIEACVNSSSVSIGFPTIVGKVLTPLRISAASYDPDGDSLTFELMAPQQAADFPVPNYLFPDEVGTIANQFELNAQNGEITWDAPRYNGIYSVAVRVREWRNNQLVGEVKRDLMFIIDDFAADTLGINGTQDWDTDIGGNFYFEIDPNDTLQLAFSATHQQGEPVVMVSSDIFNQAPAPVFSTTSSGSTNVNFTWVPDAQSSRAAPYFLVFTVNNNSHSLFVEHLTVMVKLRGNATYGCAAVSVPSLNPEIEMQVLPNPFSESTLIYLPESFASNELLAFSVFDLTGKLVGSDRQPGASHIKLNRNALPPGIYILRVNDGKGGNIGTAKIVIQG